MALMLAGDLSGANSPNPTLAVQVSGEIAPAGGWVQVKLSLAAPALVARGRIVMDFDPTVFGDIGTVSVFSAAGDALGYATVQGRHLDASFSSSSGGIGQLRNLPILVATIPLLSGATPGAAVSITADASQGAWQDPLGNTYSVSVTPGSVTVGGSLFIQSVTPGGGIVPAGDSLQIKGGGFTPQTTVTIDGVSVSTTSFVGPQEIDVTLGGQAEMTGKRITLQNPNEEAVVYFASLSGLAQSTWLLSLPASPPFPNAQPTFPLEAQQTGMFTGPGDSPDCALGLQNSTASPVAATVTLFNFRSPMPSSTVTIPPYSAALYDLPGGFTVVVSAKAPLRMIQLDLVNPSILTAANPPPRLSPVGPAPVQQIGFEGLAPSFKWQIGTALPKPLPIPVTSGQPGIPYDYTISASTSNGGSWLSVTPAQGNSSSQVSLTATVNPAGLAPGTYNGTITATPVGGTAPPAMVSVSLTVIPANYVTVSPDYNSGLIFQTGPAGLEPGVFIQTQPVTLNIGSGSPLTFSVTSSTQSGGNWLSVAASSAQTPATLTVTANSTGLAVGTYTGTIVVAGPQNSVTVPVSLQVFGKPQFNPQPASLVFSGQAGGPAPRMQFVNSGVNTIPSLSTSTTSGGNWLQPFAQTQPVIGVVGEVIVSVNTTGLGAGTYYGTVTLTSDSAAGPGQIPVTLYVWSAQPSVTVTPANLTFAVASGSTSAPQAISVQSNQPFVAWNAYSFDSAGIAVSCMPPTCSVTVNVPLPGTYHGTIRILAPDASLEGTVPVTVLAGATASQPPTIASIVNAATQAVGPVSPGEIITIHGIGVGPPAIDGFALDASGSIATSLDNSQILFDGKAAPLLYVSPRQVNAIVPYEVAGETMTTIQVLSNGIKSAAWGVPVAAAAPGVFTLDATGQGAAAVLNQDNSVNGPGNPAPRGTAIQIFATGGGQTSPPSTTGTITQSASEMLALAVAVTIGGADAQVPYAGPAPKEVAGLVQVNAVVPQGVTPGPAVPISIRIGAAQSPGGVTIAVQ